MQVGTGIVGNANRYMCVVDNANRYMGAVDNANRYMGTVDIANRYMGIVNSAVSDSEHQNQNTYCPSIFVQEIGLAVHSQKQNNQ